MFLERMGILGCNEAQISLGHLVDSTVGMMSQFTPNNVEELVKIVVVGFGCEMAGQPAIGDMDRVPIGAELPGLQQCSHDGFAAVDRGELTRAS